jgi:hypothetical protein
VASSVRTRTSDDRPRAAALARAISVVSGSRSTASTAKPARASSMTSPPMPQHTSRTVGSGPGDMSRPARRARCAATSARVACSRPCGVKYMTAASAPNLASARLRSSAWVSAADVRVGEYVRRRLLTAATGSVPAPTSSTACAKALIPWGSSSSRNASRSTSADATPLGRAGWPPPVLFTGPWGPASPGPVARAASAPGADLGRRRCRRSSRFRARGDAAFQ